MKTKVCDKCGKEKPINEFGHRISNPDGYNNTCKTCRRSEMKKQRGKITTEQLYSVPSEVLIKELQNRGYRGLFYLEMDSNKKD